MSTPALLGNAGVFKLASTDLSGDGNNIKINIAQGAPAATVFGDSWEEFIPGLASATVDYDGYYDYAASKIDATLTGASMLGAPSSPTAFTVNPVGGAPASGKPTFTGSLILTKYDIDVKPTVAITFQASFKVTGALVRGTL
jgi:hypothetical protein